MIKASADTIRYLMRTEKGTKMASARKYFFRVSISATKPEIKKSVEELFKVKVEKVHTAVMMGKPRRMGAHWGRRATWKRAVVTLAEGSKIEVAT